MSPNTASALALIAGTVAASVMVWRARRQSQRLEDEVRRMRRQVDEVRQRVDEKRRELEGERERARWN